MVLENIFKSREELDLTEGDITTNLFYLSLPIVLMNLLRTAYNLADTFWLGQLSKEALAAITFSFPLIFFLISLVMGIAVAGSVLVAQFVGSGKNKMVDFAASQTVTFSFIVSVILGLFGYFFIGPIISMLGAGSGVAGPATSYMRIISLGLFFMFGFATFISLMRGYGDTITPLILMFGSVVLNIILDPILIFGWGMFPALGVEGAAIATIFCRGLAFILGLSILYTGRKGVKISLTKMKPDFNFFKRMLSIGIPASLEITGRSVSVIAMIAIVGSFATTMVAGFGIGIRIFSLIFLPAIALGRGIETMTGQNLGAENYQRAEKVNMVAAKFMFVILTIFGIFIFIYPYRIASIFTTSQAVTSTAADFLRYVALSFGFIGIMRSFTGGFRGAGKTLLAAAVAILMMGFVRVPIAYILSGIYGPKGIWISFPISNVAGAIFAYVIFKEFSWKQSLTKEETAGNKTYNIFKQHLQQLFKPFLRN